MSNRVINMVYATRLGSSTLKSVAVRLADSAHDDGSNVFPSVGTIAAETEIDERTVRRQLRKLEALGVIVREAKGGKGPRSTARYRFDLIHLSSLALETHDKGGNTPPLEGGTGPALRVTRGGVRTAKGGAEYTLGGHTPPRTLIEPSLNPHFGRADARSGVFEKFDSSQVKASTPAPIQRTSADYRAHVDELLRPHIPRHGEEIAAAIRPKLTSTGKARLDAGEWGNRLVLAEARDEWSAKGIHIPTEKEFCRGHSPPAGA